MDTDVRILEVEPYFCKEKGRTPLKFGKVIMETVVYAHVRVKLENRKGEVAQGWGAIFLADFWAFPSMLVPHEQREKAMQEITRRICKRAGEYKNYGHPVDIYLDLEDEFKNIGKEVSREMSLKEEMPELAIQVCASPLDAALHDGFGRVNKISSYEGYGKEFMKRDLSFYLGEKFKGKYIGDYLRRQYLERLPVFHLVGGLDKLSKNEVDQNDPQDGLPNSLEEWIEKDGLICLKIKLRGNDLAWDINRTLEVFKIAQEVQKREGREELYLSVDTNEVCESPQYMIDFLEKVKENSPQTFNQILYLEQPTERELRRHRFDMHKLARIKPVIVDESLQSLKDFDLAMQLGWSGIALKTCKGQSHSLLYIARAEESNIPYTVQDLTNPGLALIHSIGLAARINTLKGVEANSRQYFPSLSIPEARVHPRLFNIKEGQASTESLQGNGLGYQIEKIERDLFKKFC